MNPGRGILFFSFDCPKKSACCFVSFYSFVLRGSIGRARPYTTTSSPQHDFPRWDSESWNGLGRSPVTIQTNQINWNWTKKEKGHQSKSSTSSWHSKPRMVKKPHRIDYCRAGVLGNEQTEQVWLLFTVTPPRERAELGAVEWQSGRLCRVYPTGQVIAISTQFEADCHQTTNGYPQPKQFWTCVPFPRNTVGSRRYFE